MSGAPTLPAGATPLIVEVKAPAPGATSQAPAPQQPAGSPAPQGQPAGAPAGAPAQPEPTPAPLSVDPPAPPEPPKAPDAGVTVEYAPTGDSSLDLALAFVGERGFGPDRPEMKAASAGDFGPLEASLKALGDKAKGFERYLKAAKSSYEARGQATKAAAEKTQALVVETVGGAQAWNAIHAWVMANADDAERKQINAAWAAGGLAAKAMAKSLAEGYRSSGASTLPPKAAVKADAERGQAGPGDALTPAQYKAEIARITAKYGTRAQYTEEFASAQARRRAFRA